MKMAADRDGRRRGATVEGDDAALGERRREQRLRAGCRRARADDGRRIAPRRRPRWARRRRRAGALLRRRGSARRLRRPIHRTWRRCRTVQMRRCCRTARRRHRCRCRCRWSAPCSRSCRSRRGQRDHEDACEGSPGAGCSPWERAYACLIGASIRAPLGAGEVGPEDKLTVLTRPSIPCSIADTPFRCDLVADLRCVGCCQNPPWRQWSRTRRRMIVPRDDDAYAPTRGRDAEPQATITQGRGAARSRPVVFACERGVSRARRRRGGLQPHHRRRRSGGRGPGSGRVGDRGNREAGEGHTGAGVTAGTSGGTSSRQRPARPPRPRRGASAAPARARPAPPAARRARAPRRARGRAPRRGPGSTTGTSSTSSTASSTSTSSSSSSTSSGSTDPAQHCVDTINSYRATLGLPAYTRWTANEACVAEEATTDGSKNSAHWSFINQMMCGSNAEDECPGYADNPLTANDGIDTCLALMWAEKDQSICSGCATCDFPYDNCTNCLFSGSAGECGHYLNMKSKVLSTSGVRVLDRGLVRARLQVKRGAAGRARAGGGAHGIHANRTAHVHLRYRAPAGELHAPRAVRAVSRPRTLASSVRPASGNWSPGGDRPRARRGRRLGRPAACQAAPGSRPR